MEISNFVFIKTENNVLTFYRPNITYAKQAQPNLTYLYLT